MTVPHIKWLLCCALAATLSGCATGAWWPPLSNSGPASNSYESRTRAPAPSPRSVATPESASLRIPSERRSPAHVSIKPSAKSPAAVITMGDAEGAKAKASQVIADTTARLGTVDQEKLSAIDATQYRQATSFMAAARDAMQQQDYLAANGLAQKAAALTERIGTMPLP